MSKAIRPIRIEGNLAYITLTKGYEAVIDAADVHLIDGHNWHASIEGGSIYAMRKADVGGQRLNVRMHRVIMGDPSGLLVDHKDGNGLRNQRSNLRLATKAQNTRNSKMPADNSSGFKGVCRVGRSNKWRARISTDGVRRSLGVFDAPEEAHAAYSKANAELHGEFGRVS